jgi:hypothetical protein
MTWLTPTLAIIAGSIAVPSLIILYFLKLRRRDLEISTTLLWKKAIQDLQANAPFQKLRRNLLLFLQLLVLTGIILALGQPQIKGQNIVGSKHVILIDRSGSMAALDEDDGKGGKMSRLAAAKKQAIAMVESLSEGNIFNKSNADEAMVIAFDSNADVRQGFTSDKNVLRSAIESITQTDGPTSIQEAMRLAIAHKPARIVENRGLDTGVPVTHHIYSDGRLPDADKALPGADDIVQFHKLGKPDSTNLAIVGLRSERNYDDPNKLAIFVALQNNDKQQRTVDVEILIDGVVAGIKAAQVAAATAQGPELSPGSEAQATAREREAAAVTGARPSEIEAKANANKVKPGVGGVVFQLERGQGAVVQVRLRNSGTGEPVTGDVLPTDDRAWVVVQPARKMAVALVGRKDLFISSVIEGLPLSRFKEMTGAEFEDLSRQGKLGDFDVFLMNGYVPAPPESSKPPATPATPAAPNAPVQNAEGVPSLPPGRYLVLGGVPLNMGITDKGPGPAASVVDWNRDHPVLRSVKLDQMTIAESRVVEAPKGGGAEVIGSADNGPIVLEATNADTRAIVVPFNVANSDWPFKPGFVVFLASAINYLGEDGGSGTIGRLVQPGSVLSDRVPSGATDVKIHLPDNTDHALTPAQDGRIVFGPLPTTGIYEVSWKGPSGATDVEGEGNRILRDYAANLLDPAESDLGATDTVGLASKEVTANQDRASSADKKLWPWLLLAALMIVMFEWFIYNRKVYL